MQKLEEKFKEFISKKNLIVSEERVLLAVSGGMDSSVMVDLFSKAGFDFAIAHCNFSLRGKESDDDASFVETLAKKYDKAFHLKIFDTKKYSEENSFSIQEAARELRYRWFNDLCIEFGYNKIATAHHLDDSIETFFINLMRGTGVAGLRGIPLVNGKVIRPLLFARRSEIEDFAKANKIEYREDSSNESDDYLRNRIRHHLVTFLKENSGAFEENMKELMEDFALIYHRHARQMDEWKKEHARRDDNGNISLPLSEILANEQPASFLSSLLYSYGITGIDCEKVIGAEMPGKIFHAKHYTILRDRDFLILQKKNEQPADSFSISALPAEINTGEYTIIIRDDENQTAADAGTKNIFWLNGELISFPLTLRTWKPGDFFFPLGMKGKKKISDFYTDEKINRFEKDKIYLLLSGNDIVCILGHRIDERYKITPSTKKILTVELIKP